MIAGGCSMKGRRLSDGEWIGMLLLVTVACAELPLLAYRFCFGVNRLYPWVAAPVRALAYSPTILAGGHGAMPFLTGPGLWMALTGRIEPGFLWLVWAPALVSAPICFIATEGLRQANLPKDGSPRTPRISVTWHRGLPLFRREGGPDRRFEGPLDTDQAWRVQRQREVHAAVFYFVVVILVALLIGLLI